MADFARQPWRQDRGKDSSIGGIARQSAGRHRSTVEMTRRDRCQSSRGAWDEALMCGHAWLSTLPGRCAGQEADIQARCFSSTTEGEQPGRFGVPMVPFAVHSGGAQPRGQGVANVYTEYFTASGRCCIPEPRSLFLQDIPSLARGMQVPGRRVFEVISPKRSSPICSRLNWTIMAPTRIRCLASLPVPKSRWRNSCDISSRNACSRHPHRLRLCRHLGTTAAEGSAGPRQMLSAGPLT